jgi:hypothetical protein
MRICYHRWYLRTHKQLLDHPIRQSAPQTNLTEEKHRSHRCSTRSRRAATPTGPLPQPGRELIRGSPRRTDGELSQLLRRPCFSTAGRRRHTPPPASPAADSAQGLPLHPTRRRVANCLGLHERAGIRVLRWSGGEPPGSARGRRSWAPGRRHKDPTAFLAGCLPHLTGEPRLLDPRSSAWGATGVVVGGHWCGIGGGDDAAW